MSELLLRKFQSPSNMYVLSNRLLNHGSNSSLQLRLMSELLLWKFLHGVHCLLSCDYRAAENNVYNNIKDISVNKMG